MQSHTASTTFNSLPPTNQVPDMSIILVCWNNQAYLEPCLRSLYEGGLQSSFDVIVVDNGSTDGSQEMLHTLFPEVQIIQNDHNVGLGRASNQGIEATSGRYALLLNNDTLVNGASLDKMVNFLDKHPEAGAVGGRLLNPDGSFQAAGNNFPSLHEEFLITYPFRAAFWPNYPDDSISNQVKSVRLDWFCVLASPPICSRSSWAAG